MSQQMQHTSAAVPGRVSASVTKRCRISRQCDRYTNSVDMSLCVDRRREKLWYKRSRSEGCRFIACPISSSAHSICRETLSMACAMSRQRSNTVSFSVVSGMTKPLSFSRFHGFC
jgi:hypothetical protein